MATVSEFKTLFPEFAAAGDPRLDLALSQAAARVSDTYEEPTRTEAIYLELAVALSAGTKGRQTRKEGQESTYLPRLRALQETHAIGRRVF